MGRNLFRRIEVAFPVLDPTLKRRVIDEGLRYYIKDNTNAWVLQTNGEYKRRKIRRKQIRFGAQQYLASVYDANAQGLTVTTVDAKASSAKKEPAGKVRKTAEKTRVPAAIRKTTAKTVSAKPDVEAGMPSTGQEERAAPETASTSAVNKAIEIPPATDSSST